MPSLFELPDPFAQLQRRMRPPNPFAAVRGGSTTLEDDYELAPEEREGLLRSLGRKTVGGIGAVANLIDLPGSMIRDTIGLIGSGGNFAKYNPLDQLASPFSPDNRTSGRSLLEGAGVLNRNRPGFDFGDVAGFGVDLVTDPLSWISGGIAGAGTKFGKIASKAGVLDDVLRVGQKTIGKDVGRRFAQRSVTARQLQQHAPEAWSKIEAVANRSLPGGAADLVGMMDDPVRSAFGVTVPFTNTTLGNLGKGAPATSTLSQGINKALGAVGLDVVNKTPLDAIGGALRWSTPGRHLASLFSAANKGRKTKEVQQAAQQLTQGERFAEHEVRGHIIELATRLRESGKLDKATSWTLRQVGEGVAPASADVQGVAAKLRELFDADFRESIELGLERNQLQDEAYGSVIDYVTRYADPSYTGKGGGGGGSRIFKTKSPEDLARKQIFKGVRGGTEYLNNSVIMDDAINTHILSEQAAWDQTEAAMRSAGASLEDIVQEKAQFRRQLNRDVADMIETNHGANIEPKYEFTRRGKTVQRDRYAGLANWMIAHPEQRAKGLFTQHILADANRALASSARKKEVAKTVLDFIQQNARNADEIPDGVRVHEVIKKMEGFNEKTERMIDGAMQPVDTVYDVLTRRSGGVDATWANKMLPKDLAEDLVGLMPRGTKDESLTYFGDLWNSFNSLWKASVLTRPARYFRDQFSGLAQNAQEGMFSIPSALTARRVLLGKTAESAMNLRQVQERLADKGLPLNAANATRELRMMYAQYGPGIHNIATETVGRTTGGFEQSLDELLATMPRSDPTNELGVLGEIGSTFAGRAPGTTLFNKPKVRGVLGAEDTTFGPIKAGEMAGRYTDDMNRMQPFVYLLEQGWEPEAAMRRVNQVQVNYDPRTFTPTERVLKQLFPFYTFSSRMAGYTAKTLAQRPGGPMGQTIKALNAAKSDDPLLPEYVANTAAIPWGETPEGSKRYLTGASLMWEDPMQFLGGGLGGASLEAMSRMAPIPKYLAELGTGQSFFQRGTYGGRSLDDLDPPMGRIRANIEEMVTGKPSARVRPVGSDAIEQIVGTLVPAGSTLTTALRKLTEKERGPLEKAINLGTGFQTSLIRPQSQDAILDELIRKEQRKLGGRSFTKTFIPEEVRATFDPIERLAASRITALAEELAARKKERKKQRMAAGR